jgi:hypothetical protein
LYKLGKRKLVYRLPKDAKRFVVSKPLVFVLALLLAVFVTGYVNGGHVPLKNEGRVLPTAVVPNVTFHRLITISAVHGAIKLPVKNVSGELV